MQTSVMPLVGITHAIPLYIREEMQHYLVENMLSHGMVHIVLHQVFNSKHILVHTRSLLITQEIYVGQEPVGLVMFDL